MGYLSGQGRLYRALRDANGNALTFAQVGNTATFEIALSVDTVEHKESSSGNRLVDLRLITGQKTDITINFQEFTPNNMAILLYGKKNTLGAGSVTAELLGGGSTAVVNGDIYMLQNSNVTALVITDSAGTPATLTLGTDYSVNLPYGLVTILNIGSFVQPFKAAYTKQTGQVSNDMFTTGPSLIWLRFLAVNTAQKNTDASYKKFMLDLYNVQFDPTNSLPMINDAVADMQVKGSVLVDPIRSPTAVGGNVGNLTWIDTPA